MKKFKNTDQMRSFMKKESTRLGIGIKNVYTTFVSRAFLEKLAKCNPGTILVKGSSAETAYLGKLVRGITDVDLACCENLEVNLDYLRCVLEDNDTNNLKFSLSKKPYTTPTGIHKYSLEASLDKTKQPLGVDLQDNYGRLIEKTVQTMPAIFEEDEEFSIIAPSFEEYLAEKLCIILESNKVDVLNTRLKDFYDIYELHGGKYDPEKLTKYFKKMLLLRGKIAFDDATTKHLDRDFVMNHSELWDSTKEKYDFLDSEIDLYGAVYYTRAVLREELQKNGGVLHDNLTGQKRQFVYR